MQLINNIFENNEIQNLIINKSGIIEKIIKRDIVEINNCNFKIIKCNLNDFVVEDNISLSYLNMLNFVENDISSYLKRVSIILDSNLDKEDTDYIFSNEGLITGLITQYKKDKKLDIFAKSLEDRLANLDEELIKSRNRHNREEIKNQIKELEDEIGDIYKPKYKTLRAGTLGGLAGALFGHVGLGPVGGGIIAGYAAHKSYQYLKRFLRSKKNKNIDGYRHQHNL